jgi:Predicted membrane protein
VPLSEHEQRLLEQIERALYAEDPKFASTVRGGRLRKPTRRRRVQGVAVFVLGLVLLVVGVAVPQLWLASSFPVLSVVGFLLMLGGAVLAVTAVGGGAQSGQAKESEQDKNRFTGRMEERFRRRFEQE